MSPAFKIATAGALTILGTIARHKAPAPRVFIGVVAAGAILLLVADSAPEAANAFGTVVLLTALLTSGYDVAQGINHSLS